MIPPTYGVIAATTSDHDGEKAHEGLGIGRLDVTLTPKRVEGELEILNIPKILGGVVAATTNGEPLVESSIFVSITTKV